MEWLVLILIVAAGVRFYKKRKISNQDNILIKENKSFEVKKYYDKDSDNFEGWFYEEVEDYIPIKKSFKIKYKDGKDNITNREIYINKFGKAPFGGFILAHCSLRNGNRTFRTDRITECIDIESGEYINDISRYLEDIYLNSEEYKNYQELKRKREDREVSKKYIDEFLNRYDNLLKILIYIVRCDGTYNAKEKAIIKELFEDLEEDNELLTDKILHKILLDSPIPTNRSFKINVDKFIKENKYPQINLIDIAQNIISTQKNIHPNEQEILNYFSKKISN